MPKKQTTERMYGLCVREGSELFLLRRIKRDSEGTYLLPPRDDVNEHLPSGKRKKRNSHISYKTSGEPRIRSFGKKFLITQGERIEPSFHGTKEVGTEPITSDQIRSIKSMVWKPEQFTELVEVPFDQLRPERYPTYMAIHLAEPGVSPNFPREFRIIQQWSFQDVIPLIWVTLIEAVGWPAPMISQDTGYLEGVVKSSPSLRKKIKRVK